MISQPNKDLTDYKFGQLKVIEYIGNSKWKCQCDCGKITEVKTSSLNSGKTKSCGCLRGKNTKNNIRNMSPKEDLTNKTFGYLTPVYYIKGGKWHCKCKCGKEIDVDTRNLNSGHTQSCGCLQKEKAGLNNVIDMTNFENDTLKVIERSGSDNQGTALWKCVCKECGNIFITRGCNIRNGDTRTCGCVHSFNEKKITQMLLENNIEFATQYTFPDLKGKNNRSLRFDFAIFQNNQLHHLIEYNGMQHYQRPQGSWGEGFDDLIKNDKKKIEYCKQHNIELRIIKYDQIYDLDDLI